MRLYGAGRIANRATPSRQSRGTSGRMGAASGVVSGPVRQRRARGLLGGASGLQRGARGGSGDGARREARTAASAAAPLAGVLCAVPGSEKGEKGGNPVPSSPVPGFSPLSGFSGRGRGQKLVMAPPFTTSCSPCRLPTVALTAIYTNPAYGLA